MGQGYATGEVGSLRLRDGHAVRALMGEYMLDAGLPMGLR